jgi:hypothetical protein
VQSDKKTVILLMAVAAIFMCGIGYLFVLRYRAGDIYPVYSSLRADPIGTKAFYESLERCRQVSVTRNYEDIRTLDLDPDTTFLWLGDTIRSGEIMDGDTIGTLNAFVRRGGRIVFAFLPTNRKKRQPPTADEEEDEDEDKDEEEDRDKDGDKDEDDEKKNRRKVARADKAPPPT